MKRHWYRCRSDGTFFRNCPLIMAERKKPLNMILPWRNAELADEWHRVFRQGVRRTAVIDRRDTFETYDDSPEATDRWVTRFLDSNGRDVSL